MAAVKDRLEKLEHGLIEMRREIAWLKKGGGGVLPEYADLRTIGKMFGNYHPSTLRYRIRKGLIPANIVRKEGKKYLININSYREIFI